MLSSKATAPDYSRRAGGAWLSGQHGSVLTCYPQGPTPATSQSPLQLLLPWADPTAGSCPTSCAQGDTGFSFLWCSSSSFAALRSSLQSIIKASPKRSRERPGSACCAAASAPPSTPGPSCPDRLAEPHHAWGRPSVCPEHRGCGAPHNKVHLTLTFRLCCTSLEPSGACYAP